MNADAFRAELAGKAVWKLLVKGLEVFVPGRTASIGDVRITASPALMHVPVFANGTGFGVQLRKGKALREPEREIYVRGDSGRIIGIAIVGPAAAIGTRTIDAVNLVRYARWLTYQTLYNPADSDSVGAAVRAARALQDVVFLDPAAGIGLGVEIDPVTRSPLSRLLVGFGDTAAVTVQAYPVTGRPAQPVRSQN
ncbi:MAG: hypothetical protein ABIQ26_21735 [Streptosporangiaceae bacterium]